MPVEVVHWNPLRPIGNRPAAKYLPIRRRVNNFGDLIGPLLVGAILDQRGVGEPERRQAHGRLMTVGSIMRLSRAGDVVWGTGINGKSLGIGGGPALDVRAVRGPLTRTGLQQAGAIVPRVFGDPGLLWAKFWPRTTYVGAAAPSQVTIVPNFHDWPAFSSDPRAIDPRRPVHEVAARIANSDFVCGSSLHGVVLAESFGIPARLIRPSHEPPFKYDDYYRGTGRDRHSPASTPAEAIDLGGESPPDWDPDPLLSAFPLDMWERGVS